MNLKYYISCLLGALILFSCNRVKGPAKPEHLISKKKMVSILIDAKFLVSANSANKKTMKDSGVNFNEFVYKKHNIDSLQFALSNDYYAFHLKDYKEIYKMVEDSLEALKVEFKALEAKEWKDKTKKEEEALKKAKQPNETLEDVLRKDSIPKNRKLKHK